MTEYTVGAWLDIADEMAREQREEERDDVVPADPLAGYTAVLRYAHPPQECGDPMDCEQHREMHMEYYEKEQP